MVKKRYFFILVCSVLLLVSLVAAEKEIYSGTVRSGTTVLTEAGNFSVVFPSSPDSILIRVPSGKRVMVQNATCALRDNYRVCYDNNEVYDRNYSESKDIYEATVRFLLLAPVLDVQRNFSSQTFAPFTSVNMEIKLTNNGDQVLEGIQYQDSFPDAFALGKVIGCSILPGLIEWEGSLAPQKTHVCSLSVTGKKPTTFQSGANVSYLSEGSRNYVNVEEQELVVHDFALSLSSTFDSSPLHIGENSTLKMVLRNLNETKKTFVNSFLQSFPPAWDVKNETGSLITRFEWTGELQPNETTNFTFTIVSKVEGEYFLRPKAEFIFNKFLKTASWEIPLQAFTKNFSMVVGVEPILAREEGLVEVELKNSEEITFKNIYVTVVAGFLEQPLVTKVGLLPALERRLVKIPITAPSSGENKTYLLEVRSNFSWFDEEFVQNLSANMLVVGNLEEGIGEQDLEVSAEPADAPLSAETITEITDKKSSEISAVLTKKTDLYQALFLNGLVIFLEIVIIVFVGLRLWALRKSD